MKAKAEKIVEEYLIVNDVIFRTKFDDCRHIAISIIKTGDFLNTKYYIKSASDIKIIRFEDISVDDIHKFEGVI